MDSNRLLYNAVVTSKVDDVRNLLDSGVDPNIENNKRKTPLYWAAYTKNDKIVKLLLDKGADPNIEDNEGKTPLYWAAYTKNHKILELLLAKGADPNIEDNEGKTPLYWAVFTGNIHATNILLQHGANPNKPDKKGDTPLSIAERLDKKSIVKIIKKRMRTMGPVESVYSVLGNNSPFIHDNRLVRDLHEYTRSEGGKRRTIKKKSNKRHSRIKK
jgi:ankyrin repeat protein